MSDRSYHGATSRSFCAIRFDLPHIGQLVGCVRVFKIVINVEIVGFLLFKNVLLVHVPLPNLQDSLWI